MREGVGEVQGGTRTAGSAGFFGARRQEWPNLPRKPMALDML